MLVSEKHNINVTKFIATQRVCANCDELASLLGMKIPAVKQRIRHLIKKGWSKKLRPYNDLNASRGRKRLADELSMLDDYVPPTCPDEISEVGAQINANIHELQLPVIEE